MDSNERYNKALKIDSQEIFEYGMNTNVGDAFVYGDFEVLTPVTYPEIGGQYAEVEKVKEEYTMHTRTVTYTDANGKTKTKTETYWSWDVVDRESIKAEKVKFLGVEFKYNKFKPLETKYIDTIKKSMDVRYKYYGSPIKTTGTIFTNLENNDIENGVKLYEKSIDETYEYLTSSYALILFWLVWIVLTGFITYQFCIAENRWLNY